MKLLWSASAAACECVLACQGNLPWHRLLPLNRIIQGCQSQFQTKETADLEDKFEAATGHSEQDMDECCLRALWTCARQCWLGSPRIHKWQSRPLLSLATIELDDKLGVFRSRHHEYESLGEFLCFSFFMRNSPAQPRISSFGTSESNCELSNT